MTCAPRHPRRPAVPLSTWQRTVDLIARICDAPVALLVEVADRQSRVLVRNPSPDNPFAEQFVFPDEMTASWRTLGNSSGTATTGEAIHESNPVNDWLSAHGMQSCLSAPIFAPRDNLFGFLCIMDRRPRAFSRDQWDLLNELKRPIETDLAQIDMQAEHRPPPTLTDAEKARLLDAIPFDAMPFMVAVLDTQCRYRAANQNYFQKFGFQEERDIQGLHVRDVLTEAGWRTVHSYIVRALNGESVRYEATLPLHGALRYVQVNYVPNRDDAGRIVGFFAIVADHHDFYETEQRYRLMTEAVLGGGYEWHIPSGDVFFSERYLFSYGFDPHTMTHDKDFWVTQLHPDDRERVLSTLTNYVAGHATEYLCEYRMKRGSGDYGWNLDVGRIIERDAAGAPVKMVGINTDITAQKMNEERLRESEARYRSMIENSSEAIAVFEAETGKFVDGNRNNTELFGVRIDTLRQTTVLDVSPAMQPNGRPSADLYREHIEILKQGQSLTTEWVWRNQHTHEDIVCEVRHCIIPETRPLLIRTSTVDIRERKQQENALRKSEENLRTTLNSIGDAVIATSTDGKVEMMNPVAETLTGWPLHEAVGQPLDTVFCIVNGLSRTPVDNPVARILDTGEIVGLASHTILISRDQREYHIADSGAPIRTESGETFGVVLVFRDVTEEHAVQEQLHHNDKMQSIGMLAGGIAHDFNNMLGGISSAAEVLNMNERARMEAKSVQCLDVISQSVARAADLTSKLTAFSRKGSIEITTVDAHQLIKDSTDILELTIDRKIEISCHARAARPFILGDASAVQSVLMNISINAVQAMPQGGRLDIATRNVQLDHGYCNRSPFELTPGIYLEVAITDTGCGIAAEHQHQIFEPFFSTKGNDGTGLGLAAVFGTMQDHHGEVKLDSRVGQGTTFYLLFPCASERAAADRPNNANIAAPRHQKILLVDDEEVIRITGQLMLETLGYQAVTAIDGLDAITIYQTQHAEIELVILDINMPRMSGGEVIRKLKEIDETCRVVISTGFAEPETLQQLADAGVLGILRKPYRLHEIGNVIQKALPAE